MKTLAAILATVVVAFILFHVGYRNIETTKAAAPATWEAAGYVIEGYEGYQWGMIGGGNVWHVVTRSGRPEITYHGFVTKWKGEYHIYNLRAIDAIAPN